MALTLITSKDGFNIEVDPYLWTIYEFAEYLKERDYENNKELVMKELGWLYFFNDPESDFQSDVDPTSRFVNVLDYVGLPLSWKPDSRLEKLVELYLGPESLVDKLLTTARIATDKLNRQLSKIDLDERDKSGKPIYNLKQFNETITQLPSTMESLDKAEKMYVRNKAERNNLRGGKTKAIFEDGI